MYNKKLKHKSQHFRGFHPKKHQGSQKTKLTVSQGYRH